MQTGFIEAADNRTHANERKRYWDEQIKTLGFEGFRAKVHLVKSAPKANGVRYAYYAIFIEAGEKS